jgi:hypothetical protein
MQEHEYEKWNMQMHDPLVPKVIDLFCGAPVSLSF